jgi:hypothetical protein
MAKNKTGKNRTWLCHSRCLIARQVSMHLSWLGDFDKFQRIWAL